MNDIGLGIQNIASFSPEGIFLSGNEFLLNQEDASFSSFSKEVYYKLAPSYSKFFKMDELCKLAFLTAELLLKDHETMGNEDGSDVAVIIGNKDSSLASDKKHVASIQDKETFFPSPAVFVYTLPNIMLGEICIRHQIIGENTCFIMDFFDADFIYKYVVELFATENYNQCITGWVNFTNENDYFAKLFLIGKHFKGKPPVKEFIPDFLKI